MPEAAPGRPSLRQEMLDAASRAPRALGASAPLVVAFLHRQISPDGGVRGLGGGSDLYYTAFGLQALRAVGADVPADAVRGYLAAFGSGETLDLVHLACLARCWAILGEPGLGPDACAGLLRRVGGARAEEQEDDRCEHETSGKAEPRHRNSVLVLSDLFCRDTRHMNDSPGSAAPPPRS